MKRFQKRKCDMWISNNKVLIGGAKKPHARNPNFETEETKLLISLWGDPKVQKTLITTHKKHPVIMRLADKMREHGYYRSAEEINTRIKNLKCFYNRIKKDVELGIITEPTWKHYSAMEEIINRPVFGNRVQQPHLLHLQAKEQEEAAADESSTSKPDKSVDDDDSNGFRPEDLLSVEEESEQEMDFEEGTLVTKEEPVDIDEMEQIPEESSSHKIEDVNDIFPKLSQYLQLQSTHLPSLNAPQLDIKLSPPSSPVEVRMPSPVPSEEETVPKIVNATSTSNSKISLVPTNFLMKPQQQPLQQQQQQQPSPLQQQPNTINFGGQQFVCAKSMSGGQTVYTTTNGMKVLLVNTLQKPTSTVASVSSSIQPNKGTVVVTSAQNHQIQILPKQVNTSAITSTYSTRSTTANVTRAATNTTLPISTAAAANVNNNKSNFAFGKSSRESAGFKTLLHSLIRLQSSNLAVSKERLEVEKKRLTVEQNLGERLLNVLEKLSNNSNNNNNDTNTED